MSGVEATHRSHGRLESASALCDDVVRLGPWFHNLHLPDGTETAPRHLLGDFPAVKWRQIAPWVPADLRGCRALDIGCNAGFYSFELARRGAEVTAIDIEPRYLEQARWAARQFGLEARLSFRQASVYELASAQERFDLVCFLGVLYHLRHPLLALDVVRGVTGGRMILQTLTMPGEEVLTPPESVELGGRKLMREPGWPLMAFIEGQLEEDPTNWWAPNHACVEALARAAGFRVVARPGHEIYLCEPEPREPCLNTELRHAELDTIFQQAAPGANRRTVMTKSSGTILDDAKRRPAGLGAGTAPSNHPAIHIAPPRGRLGVMLVGLGAVSTTFVAGVHAIRKGLAQPYGSLTQMGTLRLGKRTERHSPLIRELVPLAALEELEFGAWDIFPQDAYQAAAHAGVLDAALLERLRAELEAIKPWPAVFDRRVVTRIDGPNVKRGDKRPLVEQLRADMRAFISTRRLERAVVIWCASTEAYIEQGPAHATTAAFEEALDANDPSITPSMLYAYAAIMEGIPFANAAPNLGVDVPALTALAGERHVPIAGKDLKTGQTLLKTIVAPGLKSRMLGVRGWYSTNILGNRDGEVLDDPACFRTKEVSKKGVLDYLLQPDLYPALYGELCHQVQINYYPPRGDNKEGWDNIDLFGWLGYPMQLKINFLCRDSILAAPLVLDIALFLDLAQRAGRSGIQEWLSFYFKSPMHAPGLYPEHDLSIQLKKLENTLRYLKGEELVTHLGADYYD